MLNNEEAGKRYPVRLRAVVTLNHPNRWLIFIQEGTEALYCSTSPERHFTAAAGDLVEIQGTTDRGAFSPIINPGSIRVLDHPGLPAPRRMTPEDLRQGRFENVYGEITGKVVALRYGQEVEKANSDLLDVIAGGLTVNASLPLGVLADRTDLLNADVQLSGIFGTESNGKNQRRGGKIILNGLEGATVL